MPDTAIQEFLEFMQGQHIPTGGKPKPKKVQIPAADIAFPVETWAVVECEVILKRIIRPNTPVDPRKPVPVYCEVLKKDGADDVPLGPEDGVRIAPPHRKLFRTNKERFAISISSRVLPSDRDSLTLEVVVSTTLGYCAAPLVIYRAGTPTPPDPLGSICSSGFFDLVLAELGFPVVQEPEETAS